MPEQYSVEAYLRATDQGFSKAFENAERSVDKMSGTTTKAGGAMSGAFGKIVAAAAAVGGITAFAKFGMDTVKAAASVQAIRSQYEQAFKGIETAADSTMKALSEKFNIVPERLRQPMSSLQSYFLGVGMSADQALTTTDRAMRIAANGAAYYDRSIEDISTSMKSFLMGNYMVGDQFGVNANLTKIATKYNEQYGGSFEDLSEAMKQSYLLEYIQDVYELNGAMADQAGELDQAEKEARAYENTLGNFRETWKQLKATVGQNFLPMVISGMEKIMIWMQNGAKIVLEFRDNIKTLWNTFRNAPLTNNFLQAFGEWRSSARSFFETVLMPAIENVKRAFQNMFGDGEDNGGIFGTGWNFMDLWWKIQEVVNWFNILKAEFLDSTFWTSLQTVLAPVGEWFGTLGTKFGELRSQLADSAFLQGIIDGFNEVKDAIFAIDFVKIRDGIQEVIDKAADLWDIWTGSTTWTTFKDSILDPLVKKFQELSDEITKFFDTEELPEGTGNQRGGAQGTMFDSLLNIDFGKLTKSIADFSEKWLPLIAGTVGAGAIFITASVGVWALEAAGAGAAVAMGALSGAWAFLLSPIGAYMLAIAAAIAIGVYLWQNWDKIVAAAKEDWAELVAIWENFKSETERIFGAVVTAVSEKFTAAYNAVVKFFTDIWTAISGKYEEVKKAASDVFQGAVDAVEEKMEPFTTAVDNLFGDSLDGVTDWIADAVQAGKDWVQGFIDGISEKYDEFTGKVNEVIDFFNPFNDPNIMENVTPERGGDGRSSLTETSAQIETDAQAIVTSLSTANANIKPQMDTLASNLNTVDLTQLTTQKDVFTGALDGMLGSAQTTAPLIADQMTAMFSILNGTEEGGAMASAVTNVQTTWASIQATITTATTAIVTQITTDTATVATTTTTANAALVMNATATWAAIVAAVLNAGLAEAVNSVMIQALASATATAAAFSSIGLAMMQGLANGIYAGQSLVINAAVSVALAAYVAAQAALAIGSPSKKFEDLGMYSMQGLARGIIRNASDPISAIKQVARTLVNSWNTNGLNVRNADVNQRVEHVINDNMASAKPAVIRLAMGNNTYGAYVEDITGRQSHTAQLERRYLR